MDPVRKTLQNDFGRDHLDIDPAIPFGRERLPLTEILAGKQMGGNTFYLVDAGFTTSPDRSLWGVHPSRSWRAMRAIAVCEMWLSAGACASVASSLSKVAVRRHPQSASAWWRPLVLECAGAYGFVGSNYNSKPLVRVLIADGRPTWCGTASVRGPGDAR